MNEKAKRTEKNNKNDIVVDSNVVICFPLSQILMVE